MNAAVELSVNSGTEPATVSCPRWPECRCPAGAFALDCPAMRQSLDAISASELEQHVGALARLVAATRALVRDLA